MQQRHGPAGRPSRRRRDWDLLLCGGKLYSMEREGQSFAAMAVKGGRIAAVFGDSPGPAERARAREVVDLEGRAVLPGLTDGHVHFLAGAAFSQVTLGIADIDSSGLRTASLAGVAGKLRAYAAGKPARMPLFCVNYIIEAVREKRLPTARELEAWLPGREVIVLSMDGHSSAYSPAALAALGLGDLAVDGILSGSAHELNVGRVNARLARSVSVGMLARGIQQVVNEALGQGIVCMDCVEGFEDQERDPALWLLARCGGILPVDLRLHVQYRDPARLAPYLRFMRRPRIGGCFGWAMDGSISSGTAALDEPYLADPSSRGTLYFTPEEAEALVARAASSGMQVTAHAIGPRAIEVLLAAYEKVVEPGNPARHRIDHFELPRADQVRRAVALRLALVAQPGFAWLDEKFLSGYRRRLPPATFESQIPLATIAGAGGIIVGSSDFPTEPISPWLQVQGMLEYPIERERLGLYDALRTFTWNAAWAAGEEAWRGTLAAGKKADFIVMEEDPFAMPADRIREAAVRATWIDGSPARPMRMSTAGFLARALAGPRRKI